ncbi:MAG TPA: NAD(P)(+) transhydrogenase (Re/Si-specific) subunit beta [Bacteroidia bacterium]|jgi:NAD(P) transhydrogenase subunit beta|nr:NAD(P)(+) transhydrogenase (Re/Si-specific) subunit beta [Bacteroidia bacterium]
MNITFILDIIYLLASVTFILGLKMLGNPESARKGNLIAAAGMTLAILGTIFLRKEPIAPIIYGLLFGAIAIGTIIGWMVAKKVKMTAMPQLVSLFNGMGGACAALISLIEFPEHLGSLKALATVMAGLIIGSISFSGSMIAFMKLNGNLNKDIRLPFYNAINNIILLVTVGVVGYILYTGGFSAVTMSQYPHFYMLALGALGLALFYGIMFVLPIGGADMPVVISLLNSFTGLAAAAGGFLYHNMVMLTGGILVGSAGTLLTVAMCEGMNRSLFSVIFGAFGSGGAAVAATGGKTGGSIKDISVTDTAVLMNYSKKVVIVPGYGLAVAQAQHVMHELEMLLEERGVDVKYAIHPVAGRMPGHMNVLLAESNVDYSKLVEMEDINPEFDTTDVVFIVGANDVVNPAAKNNPASPIYGMPILEVDRAKSIIVNKRSMNAGYAGIDNELFYEPKTSMLFGDAKKVVTELVAELKSM